MKTYYRDIMDMNTKQCYSSLQMFMTVIGSFVFKPLASLSAGKQYMCLHTSLLYLTLTLHAGLFLCTRTLYIPKSTLISHQISHDSHIPQILLH